MKKEWRAVVLLGGLMPLTAALLYFFGNAEPSPSTPPPSEKAQSEGEDASQAEMSLEPKKAPGLPPDAALVAPASAESFEKPESEELFWKELERLEHEDKPKALAYALAGEDWYGEEGKPAEGRRAKIVTLLVDVGKMDEARARTRIFIEKYPNSSYRRLVQGVTGIHPRPGAPAHLTR